MSSKMTPAQIFKKYREFSLVLRENLIPVLRNNWIPRISTPLKSDKNPVSGELLIRHGQALLAFYDFPASHWQHLRTTNPIESTFATIRLRTVKTRNCLSVKTALSLVHQLAMSAQKRWRRLRGFRQMASVVANVKFIDGVDERETGRKAA